MSRCGTGRSALIDGFTVQIANPKAILFFTAVLPPFLDVNRPVAPQLALFALATIGMDVLSMSAYGLGGAALANRMNEPRFKRWFGVFVGRPADPRGAPDRRQIARLGHLRPW